MSEAVNRWNHLHVAMFCPADCGKYLRIFERDNAAMDHLGMRFEIETVIDLDDDRADAEPGQAGDAFAESGKLPDDFRALV